MWSGPRNVSTAMMYSFAQRGDTVVVDEPLYAHYLRVTGADHPGRETVLRSMDADGAAVMERLADEPAGGRTLFVKQMAHHWVDLDPLLLRPFRHFLLIRDPEEMLASLAEILDEISLRDTGLAEQVRLLEHLVSAGETPFCVDARDLLSDPQIVLAAVCRRLGLEYQEGMTRWEPGPRPEDGVWARWWYANVHASTGFRPWRPSRKTVPRGYRDLLATCSELYQRLLEYRIRD